MMNVNTLMRLYLDIIVDVYDKRQWNRNMLISPLLSALRTQSSSCSITPISTPTRSSRSDYYYGLLMGICALVKEDMNMNPEEVEFVLNEVTTVLNDECRMNKHDNQLK